MKVSLIEMEAGKSGTIVEVLGGRGHVNRLDALGIRLCKNITKVSSMLMRGPIVVGVGNSTIAIGYGMARKIIVEVTDEDTAYGQS